MAIPNETLNCVRCCGVSKVDVLARKPLLITIIVGNNGEELSSPSGVSAHAQRLPCAHSHPFFKLRFLGWLPSCELTVRCGEPSMNVDHFPGEAIGSPHRTVRLPQMSNLMIPSGSLSL